jgi:hypothetical protein
MHTFRWNLTRVRLLCLGLLLLGISSLPISSVAAESMQEVNPAERSNLLGWMIYFSSVHARKLCVGQKTTLEVTWGSLDPLLTPLTSLSSIDVFSKNGNSTDPEELRPMVTSGAASSIFEAKKAGTDTVTTTLYTYNFRNKMETSVASDTTTIKVLEKCQYRFKLHAVMNVTFAQAGITESVRYTIDSQGVLTVDDPAHPELLTASDKAVFLTIEITDLKAPDCVLISQAGSGYGNADASAEIWGDGKKIRFTLSPPADFQWGNDATGRCGDTTGSVHVGGEWTSDAPLVDGEDFSSAGGTGPVQMEFFEKALKTAATAGGTGSYTAMLTLKALDPNE